MLSRSLADRYDWHMRDVPILQWKTVIHDLSPVWGKIYSAHQNLVATWPGLRPLINHEALEAAQACCKRYEVVDLWLDNSTLNISQPCLVDVASDIFRVDPGIAKMMLGLEDTPWLARVRRVAIGPFDLRGPYDVISILRVLELTRDLEEVYVLLSQEVAEHSQTLQHNTFIRSSSAGFNLVGIAVGERFEAELGELESQDSDAGDVPGDSGGSGDTETLGSIVHELSRRCSNARIAYGYVEV